MTSGQKLLRFVVPSVIALVLIAGITYQVSLRRSLLASLERLSKGMTLEDVRTTIPKRFFDEEGMASRSSYLVDRVFQNGAATRFLTYRQRTGERFADAQVSFDQNDEIIGLSYTADGFPLLRETRTDGVGPRGSRTYIPGTAIK